MPDEIKNRTVYMLCRKGKTGEDGVDLYIGSTSRSLKERLVEHRYCAKNNGCSKLHKRMGEVGLQNWKIVPLITFACDKKTIFEFEKQWVNSTGANLNTRSPVTDRKEYNASYYLENKKAINKRHVAYREANKKNILEQQAAYRGFNVKNKVHYCGVCDKSFGYRKDLDKHYKTHSHAYMSSCG